MKYSHKVIIINVVSFVVYFGVSTLIMSYTSLQSLWASVIAFAAAIVVHEILLIMNRPPPDLEPGASDLNEGTDEDTG